MGFTLTAGKTVNDDELEEMLEKGNSAVFTQGVRMDKDLFLNKNTNLTTF